MDKLSLYHVNYKFSLSLSFLSPYLSEKQGIYDAHTELIVISYTGNIAHISYNHSLNNKTHRTNHNMSPKTLTSSPMYAAAGGLQGVCSQAEILYLK